MRQAILRAPRTLDLVEVPTPEPAPGEVIVRVLAGLTCGTDLKTYRRGHARLRFGPFGHEAAGEIVSAGDGVTAFGAGQPVVFTPTAACGDCGPCRRSRENLCTTLFDEMAIGAYGDMMRVPARIVRRHLFLKPPSLSYIEAAFLEPLACVVHAWRRLGGANGERVAVIGVGAIGLLHVHEASRRGLEVIAVGRRPEGLGLAARLGARHVVNAREADPGDALRSLTGDGPEIVVECTGSEDIWQAAPGWAAPGGRVLLFGGLAAGSQPRFDATRLHYGEVDLVSAFHYRTGDVRDALTLLASGAIRPAALITGLRPLDDIKTVFDDLDRGAGIKYAILPDGGTWR
ncbi:MAG: zinc-dependent alcohol dehydrogenase [bacterium]